ncbi:uncharacterized protein LOC129407881 [Boleophthalmus pectinirostris]|uniref:uncharacterized protein LOC129407881 n=1 Tax=Boleophthalmus pectinirostris TaxID=150288 RepID=UPI00243257F2|nr:uncharacterized protein LOC129407881 [Boleophthalmus pectinirostris]
MWGHTLLQSVVVFWLVQTARTRGFGAVSGVNTQGPQNNGRYPQNGGAMPSKGVGQVMGVQNGFGGYPTKGLGYGGAATGISSTNGAKYNGYGAAARTQGGAAMKGYGAAAGVFNGHRGKPQGYNSLAGITQGGPANKGNGNTAYQGAQNGYGTKSGQKAINGPARRPSNGAGLHGQAGAKPMKGYGRPPYGTGMGAFRGMGPAQAGHQGTAYGSNGYGAKNMGGYRPNGGLGAGAGAGSGLGSRYGNGGMKGPKPGYGDVAGGANEQATKHGGGTRGPIVNGAMSNGYGYGMGGANKPAKPGYGGNGYGAKPNGYNMNRAGIIRPQPGYTNGAGSMKPQPGYTNGAGSMKPQPGYTNGAGMGAFGGQTKGYGSAAAGAGATKGNGAKNNGQRASGAALGGYGNKLNGYGVPGQSAGAGNAGYGISSGKSNSVGALGGPGLKGLLSAAQPTAAPPQGYAPQGYAPQGFVPQLSLSQGGAPVGPESTGALQGRGTPDQYQKLQGKVFSPQATAGPALGPQYSLESTAAGPTPLPALMGSGGKSSKVSGAAVTQSSGALQPSAVLPQGKYWAVHNTGD